MKKVMWLFGKPGAGRTTLVKNILEDKQNERESLEIYSDNIIASYIQDDSDSIYYDYNYAERRKNEIFNSLNRFIDDNNDVLLLNGEFADYSAYNDSVLNIIKEEYKIIEQELLLLSPRDLELLYKRLINTEWYKNKSPELQRRFPIEWLRFASEYLREGLQRYNDHGYTLYDVDTTNGYDIKKHVRTK